MDNNLTIKQAIKQAMTSAGHPLTAKEAYQNIVKNGLYEFNSTSPVSIVQTQLRRHTVGVESKASSTTKEFKQVGDSKYWLAD